jgi:hypothetical protein
VAEVKVKAVKKRKTEEGKKKKEKKTESSVPASKEAGTCVPILLPTLFVSVLANVVSCC